MSEQENSAIIGGEVVFNVQSAIDSLKQMSAEVQKVKDLINQPVKGQTWIQGADGSIRTLTQMNQEYAKFAQRMEQRGELHTQKMENIQKLSDQRLENENARAWQKMEQDAQLYQTRMQKLMSQRSTSHATSSPFAAGFGLGTMVDVAGGIALYHIVDGLMQIPQEAMVASDALVKLQQVLEMSPNQADIQRYGDLNGMLKELQQTAGTMAQTYGVNLDQVLSAMSQIGRKWKSVSDIVVLTDTALQMTATDAVPLETSVSSLEALMSQFGLSTGQARQALFELTAAAHSMQMTGTDLMQAIERSGASFKTLKFNTAESIAAISTLGQVTAAAGGTIGNSFKSILDSLTSDKGVQALHQLGIEAFNANGQLKDGVTILEQLQEKWPKLTDEAKIHFAEVLAGGKYNYERLLSFLNDYSNQFQKALTSIKQANAQQQQQLVATAMESPTKQLQMTQASFQVLATTIMQQVNPAMIQFLTEVRLGTSYVNEHWSSIEHWLGTGAKLAEAYIAWKVALAAYNAVLDTAIGKQLIFGTGVATIIGRSQGFVAGLQAMGGAVAGFTASVTAAMAKLAGFIAVFQVVSNLAARAADSSSFQVGDLQSQLDVVNKQIAALQNGGGRIGAEWENWKQVAGDVLHGDIIRGTKDMMQHPGLVGGGDVLGNLQRQKQSLESQLAKAKADQQKQQAEEIQQALDQVNQVVAQAMQASGGGTHYGPPYIGSDTRGTWNPSPTGGGGGGSNAHSQRMQQYMDIINQMSQRDDQGLQYYADRVNNASYALDRMNQEFSTANDNLQKHATDTKAASDAVKAYNDDVKALSDHANSLAAENWQLQQEMNGVSKKMQQVDADYKAGKIDAQTHADAVYQLTQEYDRLTQSLNDNTQAIAKDKDAINQATADLTSDMVSMLESAYQTQQKIEEANLKKMFDDKIAALQNQKDQIDAAIKNLQDTWSQQDEQNKLSDLQSQLAAVESDKRFEIVGLDGKLTYTYDTAKATDLQKQIADEQTQIQRNAQLKQLQNQSDSLAQQIKNLQDTYQTERQKLDDYWAYKEDTDRVQSQVDNLILKHGMEGALQIVQQYADPIVQKFNDIAKAKADAWASMSDFSAVGGGALSDGSGSGTSGGSLNSYWQSVQQSGHTQRTVQAGESISAVVTQEAAKYGVSTSDVQVVHQNGKDYVRIPWADVAAYAYRQSGVAHLDTGGEIPHGREGFAYLHQNEVVLNSGVVNGLKNLMVSMPKLLSPSAISTPAAPITINGVNLQFPNVHTAADGDGLARQFIDSIRLVR